MKITKTGRMVACIMAAVAVIGTCQVSAASSVYTPYNNYDYNRYNESTRAPMGFTLEREIESSDLQLETEFNNPTDMLWSKDGYLYLLDSGNSRIIILDNSMKPVRIMDSFTDSKGNAVSLTGVQGFTVSDNGDIYLADTENHQINVLDKLGNLKLTISKPDTPLLDSNAACQFSKVLLDSMGRIYAIADDVNLGAFMFDAEGNFLRFYGANTVTVTSQVLQKYLFRKFMSKSQLAGSVQFTPVNFSNFALDSKGFIFTVTKNKNSNAEPGTVKKLNFEGENVLDDSEKLIFGDLELNSDENKDQITKFTDIYVDDRQFLYLLDSTYGRVFLYSENGILLSEFGSYGIQNSTFGNPAAITVKDEKVYVLDNKNNKIMIFSPTEYTATYMEAITKLNEGKYVEAIDLWESLLEKDSNNETVYLGLGRAYDAMGQYKNAMAYFKKASANKEYSLSFEQYRKQFIVNNALWIVLIALTSIFLLAFVIHKIKKVVVQTHGTAYSCLESKVLFPFYTMFHPADGFIQFRSRYIMSYRVSAIIIVMWFLLESFKYYFTGFCFNENRSSDYNLYIMLLKTVGAFLLFTIANYALSTLTQGKGKFKEVFAGVAYSLLPLLFATLIYVLLSRVLVTDEQVFLQIIYGIGVLWSLLLLFAAIGYIHQFSVLKTIVSIICTIIGIGIIIFLIILIYGLASQLIAFIQTIMLEASLR